MTFHMEPQWDGGTKVCSNDLGHMTKMASMPIYGKNPSKIFSEISRPMTFELGISISHSGPTKFVQMMNLD